MGFCQDKQGCLRALDEVGDLGLAELYMLRYLEYRDWTELLWFLAKSHQLEALDSLTLGQLPWPITRLNHWQELELSLAGESSLLGGAGLILADTLELTMSAKVAEYLVGLKAADTEIYLFSSLKTELTAETRKILKKAGLSVMSVKSQKTDLLEVAKLYANVLGMQIPVSKLELLAATLGTPGEIMNFLDIYDLAGDFRGDLWNFESSMTPLYMMSLKFPSRRSDVSRWADQVGSQEYQLGISLIYTKLAAWPKDIGIKWRRSVILTDAMMKSGGYVDPGVRWKMLLWKMGFDS